MYYEKLTISYLNEHIESDVKEATVDKHIGQVSPSFLFLIWVEYKDALKLLWSAL